MLLAATVRGTGIAYGPSFVFDARVAAGDLIELLPDYAIYDLTIHAVYPSNRHVPRKLRMFIDHLAASLLVAEGERFADRRSLVFSARQLVGSTAATT